MLTLKNWFLEEAAHGYFFARGNVFGHHRFSEGEFVHTSEICKVYSLAEGKWALETFTGSLYQVSESDIDKEHAFVVKDLLSYLDIIRGDSTIQKRVDELSAVFALKRGMREKVLDNAYEWALENLENNEMYLIIDGTSPAAAFFKYEGKIKDVRSHMHVGTFHDSILLSADRTVDLDFRYFPDIGIQPYVWSDSLTKIHLHNLGWRDVSFIGSKKRIVCPEGKITEIAKETCM